MPCRTDYMDDDARISRERLDEFKQIEAALCGITRVLDRDTDALAVILDRVDWKEAGVKRHQFEQWWASHKAADELRRIREEEAREQARRIKAAKAKLSPEERELLGIK